ncbi:MAG TPA: hypothetical protein PLZ95_08410 [Bryobacteraceae bacterium]|nr:hypothetical protein [Bryobacteraceae bacterium]
MKRREFTFGLAGFAAAGPLRVAAFRADATPAMGEPLIWVDPTKEVLDPLWAKGVVIDGPGGRVVLCALDWCGIGGYVHTMFRDKLAGAVNTSVGRVAMQSVHQHAAPYIDGGGYELMAQLKNPPLMMSRRFLEDVTDRLAKAAAEAVGRMKPFDAVGLGSVALERVGSARRLMVDGRLVTRFSTSGKDPKMAELPEGDIETRLRTVTLFGGSKPLVRLHYYASHPQTFCCNGQVSADFVGAARETVEKSEGVPQIYFTGCAGDVTVGKYNDGGIDARKGLERRMEAGLRASNQSTRSEAVRGMSWKSVELRLPLKPGPKLDWPPADLASMNSVDICRHANAAAFASRRTPLTVSSLRLGGVRIVHLPGEPLLEFQRHAGDAIVAGYGDISPGYLCPDKAFEQGGYEPSASNAGPGTEAAMKQAIMEVLKG